MWEVTINAHLMHGGRVMGDFFAARADGASLRAAMLFLPLYSTVAIHKGLPKMPIVYALGALCAVV